MITGIGNDLAEVRRIAAMQERYGERFVERILTAREIEFVERRRDRFQTIAGRFAAKEALMKMLGTGLGNGVGFHDFEILPDASGKPGVTLSERLTKRFGPLRIHVTISHTDDLAAAFAVAEKDDR